MLDNLDNSFLVRTDGACGQNIWWVVQNTIWMILNEKQNQLLNLNNI